MAFRIYTAVCTFCKIRNFQNSEAIRSLTRLSLALPVLLTYVQCLVLHLPRPISKLREYKPPEVKHKGSQTQSYRRRNARDPLDGNAVVQAEF
jgi:hypothetical protein